MRHGALTIPNENDPQPIQAGKIGFRLRYKPYLVSSFEFGEQRSVRECDFDNCGVWPVPPEVLFLVGTGVFRQDPGRVNLPFSGIAVNLGL